MNGAFPRKLWETGIGLSFLFIRRYTKVYISTPRGDVRPQPKLAPDLRFAAQACHHAPLKLAYGPDKPKVAGANFL